MRVRLVTLTSSPKSLKELLGWQTNQCSFIALQVPNNQPIAYFGDKDVQPFELRSRSNTLLPVNSAASVFLKGSGQISVGLL